jgi:hypothetical protein
MFNYNASANTDDGSCIPKVFGCTDEIAFNYNASVNTDDGSCIPVMYGCLETEAMNHNATANTDDGSCIETIRGCMDSAKFEYNAFATVDDGSCSDEMRGCGDFRNPACCAALSHPLLESNDTAPGCVAHIRMLLYGFHCSEDIWQALNASGLVFNVCPSTSKAFSEVCGNVLGFDIAAGQQFGQSHLLMHGSYRDPRSQLLYEHRDDILTSFALEIPALRSVDVGVDESARCFDGHSYRGLRLSSGTCVPRRSCSNPIGDCWMLGNRSFVECNYGHDADKQLLCRDARNGVDSVIATRVDEQSGCQPDVVVCMDDAALNFNATANLDDGSCIANVSGCMNALADNFNLNATWEDGSCNQTKCSWIENDCDINATCLHTGPAYNNSVKHTCTCREGFVGPGINDLYVAKVGKTNFGIACSDAYQGQGYIMHSNQTLSARFRFPPVAANQADHFVCVRFDQPNSRWLFDGDLFVFPFVPRSTDFLVARVNFDDANFTVDVLEGVSGQYGSPAIHLGFDVGDIAVVPNVWNDQPNDGEFDITGTRMAVVRSRGCDVEVLGCMDSDALNYNPMANSDNSTWINGIHVPGCVEKLFGCMNSTMFNYNATANVDDGGCEPVRYGCIEPTALNYDPLANTDDMTCAMPPPQPEPEPEPVEPEAELELAAD